MSEATQAELEKFREQWKEEVAARSKESSKNEQPSIQPTPSASIEDSLIVKQPPQYTGTDEVRKEKNGDEDEDEDDVLIGCEKRRKYDISDNEEVGRLGIEGEGGHSITAALKIPSTALDHYEKAVEREEQGSLGDSVSLYRKAYRLDAGVDKIYRNKHFPPASMKPKPKPTDINPSNASVTVPNTAHHSLDGPPVPILTISQLIASFSGLSVVPAPPETDQSPQPPCPISDIPSELLIHILNLTATLDVAIFARLSLVCKYFAYLVATEDRIWKQICLGPKYGFESMYYDWNCSISGQPLCSTYGFFDEELVSNTESDYLPSQFSSLEINPSKSFPLDSTVFETLTSTYPTYRTMFRHRPRIRFHGCYISTVNYMRPGASTSSQISWNSPVHIITYYRYLRFFRDGSCVHLTTTSEPAEVVHYLTKANMPSLAEHGKTNNSLLPPMSFMQHALRGRWRLQSPQAATKDEPEGTLSVQTLGIDPDKYTYVLSLALRSAGRREGTRNNKLAWRGYWSYNRLTDDWAEFGLKNDKAFYWSRVGSYGVGE